MAPEVESRIADAIASGHLTLIAAKLVGVAQNAAGAWVLYRRRGESNVARLNVAIDCTGIIKDPMQTTNPAIRSLLDQELAPAHRLRGQFRLRNRRSTGQPLTAALCRRSAYARGILGDHRCPRHPRPMCRAGRTSYPQGHGREHRG